MADDHDAEIIPLRAERADVDTVEQEPARHGTPVYADLTEPDEPQRRPVIADSWRRENIRATLSGHTGLAWYLIKYHSLRAHLHTGRTLWYAVCGAGVLTKRLMRWWHAPHLWHLESVAVAAGRAGHAEAMRAHTQGLKTRAGRGRIIAVCAGVAVLVALEAARFVPHWVWIAAAPGLLLVLARHGKPQGKPMFSPAIVGDTRREKLTEDIVIRGLRHIGLSAIDKWLREDREIQFIGPVARDGPGWRAALDLPYGVTPEEILDRRRQFASGLRYPLGCVWPEPLDEGGEEHAGRLNLYVCDEPLRKARQPAWPLAKGNRFDVWHPIPFMTDKRSRTVSIEVMAEAGNMLIGSIPRRGKTQSVRLIVLAFALDPVTELRVFELKGTGDLEPVAPCCHHYGSGPDDETIAKSLASLRELAEVVMPRRSAAIKKLGKDVCPKSKVTPAVSRTRRYGLHPILFGMDECQEAFGHKEYGPLFEEYAVALIKRGPAVGIFLILATQRPDRTSLPTGVSSQISIRFCLQVMGQIENDMILGTSAYKRGIRATLFTRSDKGCGWLAGATDLPLVGRAFDVDGKKAEGIAARARVLRQQAGTLTGYALGDTGGADVRDFAADVLSVFGTDDKLWTKTIAARLAELIPEVYADVTPEAVASQLRGVGVEVKKVRERGREPLAGCARSAVEDVAGAVVGRV